MNLEYLQFDLGEAHFHLKELVRELATGELGPDDSPELAVQLEHITDHIHRAWNRSEMSNDEISTPIYDEFELHSNTAPNLNGQRILGEFALGSKLPLNTGHIHYELAEAAEALQTLLTEIKTGKLGPDDSPVLAVNLLHITDHIHRAWNCRMMTQPEISALTPEEFARLSNTIPNFSGNRILGQDAFE